MLLPIVDTGFANRLIERYTDFSSSVDAPAWILFLQPRQDEEPSSDGGRYRHSIQHIHNLQTIIENNQILNLHIGLTFLNRILSQGVREIATAYTRGDRMLEKTMLLRQRGNTIALEPSGPLYRDWQAARQETAGTVPQAAPQPTGRQPALPSLFPSDLDVVSRGLQLPPVHAAALTGAARDGMAFISQSLVHDLRGRAETPASASAAQQPDQSASLSPTPQTPGRRQPEPTTRIRDNRRLSDSGDGLTMSAPETQRSDSAHSTSEANAPDSRVLPFRQRGVSIVAGREQPPSVSTPREVGLPTAIDGAGEPHRSTSSAALPQRMIGFPTQALLHFNRLAHWHSADRAQTDGTTVLVRATAGWDITGKDSFVPYSGGNVGQFLVAGKAPQQPGTPTAAERQTSRETGAVSTPPGQAPMRYLMEQQGALPAELYRALLTTHSKQTAGHKGEPRHSPATQADSMPQRQAPSPIPDQARPTPAPPHNQAPSSIPDQARPTTTPSHNQATEPFRPRPSDSPLSVQPISPAEMRVPTERTGESVSAVVRGQTQRKPEPSPPRITEERRDTPSPQSVPDKRAADIPGIGMEPYPGRQRLRVSRDWPGSDIPQGANRQQTETAGSGAPLHSRFESMRLRHRQTDRQDVASSAAHLTTELVRQAEEAAKRTPAQRDIRSATSPAGMLSSGPMLGQQRQPMARATQGNEMPTAAGQWTHRGTRRDEGTSFSPQAFTQRDGRELLQRRTSPTPSASAAYETADRPSMPPASLRHPGETAVNGLSPITGVPYPTAGQQVLHRQTAAPATPGETATRDAMPRVAQTARDTLERYAPRPYLPEASPMVLAAPAKGARAESATGSGSDAPADIVFSRETSKTVSTTDTRTVNRAVTEDISPTADLDREYARVRSAGEIERIADRVYAALERRLRSERMRKGLL
ncbi:hypothetical protein LJC63_00720 [Ruminococcaceae bacterium OttesenSCG-928-L11]|nr:hypothetical protein [Ruminococcaceae bacterium OttesenSCG-928-L11]